MARKVYVGAPNFEKVALPSGYTQVEYIESSGTQHIDTGFVPNQDTRVIMEYANTGSYDDYSGAVGALFGARTSATSNAYALWIDENTIYPNFASKNHTANGSISVNTADKFTVDMNENVLTVSGKSLTCTDGTFSAGCNLLLFTLNGNGTAEERKTIGKLYGCKVYNSGILVRNFIPCTNASGVAGLYDLVNGAFYANAGTGTFAVGSTYKQNVAREVKKINVGVNGVARNVTSGYIGVNGVARQFWKSSIPLGEFAIGDTVLMNVNGVAYEFIVVHHGIPSSIYDSSCNGTWLLMKNIYSKRAFDATNNDYANSDIHAYLNGTFVGLFDSSVRSMIKQVKIPYKKGRGYSDSTGVYSGSNGLSSKIFLLSAYELGWTTSNYSNIPKDGACLDYFKGCSKADTKRIAYYNNTATNYWTRSPGTNGDHNVYYVYLGDGRGYDGSKSESLGIRPVVILPSDTLVSSDLLIK